MSGAARGVMRAVEVTLAALCAQACGGAHAAGGASTESAETVNAVAAIGAMLDAWHAAAARADEDTYFSYFAAGAVFLGTDRTERWDVAAFRPYAHPHFAKGKAWTFHAARRAITVAPSGDYAWFDEDLDTERLGPARGSGVVVRQGREYKLAQYNLAITVPNERFSEVRRVLEAAMGEQQPKK